MLLPIVGQSLIGIGMGVVDVFMLGRVGEIALAGASIGNQFYYIFNLFSFGLISGATVMTAQYWGVQDIDRIERTLAMILKIVVIISLLFTIAAMFAPEIIMRIFTNETAVIAEGTKYLRIISFSFVVMGCAQTYIYIMRSIERVKAGMIIYAVIFAANIVFNSILIFGPPQMGIRGAALGTLMARSIGFLLAVLYARIIKPEVKVRFEYFLHVDKDLFTLFIKLGLPVVLNELFWGIALSAHEVILGHMGSPAIAANAVAKNIRDLIMVSAYGLSSVAAIEVGQTLGRGNKPLASRYAKRFVLLAGCLGAIGGILLMLCKGPILRIMVLSSEAQINLRYMLLIMGILASLQSFDETATVGILRSGGDTRFSLILDTTMMWGFSVTLGAIAAFVLHLSVPMVFLTLNADVLVKIPFVLHRIKTGKWMNTITEE